MIIYFFKSCSSFSSIFSSIIDCFNVFSYSKVITLIQSSNKLEFFSKFDMYSFVFKMSIDVIKSVLLVNITPTRGLSNENVEMVIAKVSI